MKLGILGAGGIASTMAKTVAGMKDVEAYAVAARDLERARVFAQKYEVKKAYGSYEEMLADAISRQWGHELPRDSSGDDNGADARSQAWYRRGARATICS